MPSPSDEFTSPSSGANVFQHSPVMNTKKSKESTCLYFLLCDWYCFSRGCLYTEGFLQVESFMVYLPHVLRLLFCSSFGNWIWSLCIVATVGVILNNRDMEMVLNFTSLNFNLKLNFCFLFLQTELVIPYFLLPDLPSQLYRLLVLN